jgi:hypothetical protein
MQGLYMLVLFSVHFQSAYSQLSLTVNADASYSISHSGGSWLESASTPYAFAFNNALHTLQNGLTLDAPPAPFNGQNFTGYSLSFNSDLIEVSFQLFPSIDAIVFTQHFPKGLTSMNVNGGHSEDLATSFPTFTFSKNDKSKGFLVWPDTMCNGHADSWSKANSDIFSDGGTPLVLFNESSAVSVLSSFGGYMTTQVGLYPAVGGNLGAGYNGMISELPPGHTHQVILVGGFGINNTVLAWGDLLLGRTGKKRTRPDADLIVSTLGAWTDNGAYYYYNTEKGKTMQQTMDDLVQYLKSLSLPVRHFMYDSWWYWKECGGMGPNTWLNCRGAVELWEPRNDVFPDTFNYNVGYPLALHNRYFSARNNTYVTSLGFPNSFILEENVDFALPIKSDVFEYLMGKAKAWGMVLYEQG